MKNRKIFVAGIGGIGVSALIKILKAEGHSVQGSDAEISEITDDLGRFGISVVIGHRAENLPTDTELLIYSSAVPETNPERMRAKRLGIKELTYAAAVGEYAQDKRVIAVAGTNGKTTTTAMIGWVMEQAGLDPTVIVGSKVLAWNSNARVGQSDWLVVEADEYRRAFLNYHPDIAVITNIQPDHLDYYKDLDEIKIAFGAFVGQIRPEGALVYNPDDSNTKSVINHTSPTLTLLPWPQFFSPPARGGDEEGVGEERSSYSLKIPGKYNISNALAAAAVCRHLGIPDQSVMFALSTFTGTWRRFEKVGQCQNAEIYSDYAHHPDGLRALFEMLIEEFSDKKVLVVFQPHQHNRTKMLFRDFVQTFCSSRVENIIISEIFEVAGREESQDQDVSSQDLVKEIRACGKNIDFAKNLLETETQIRAVAKNYDMIVLIGAGDIYKVAKNLAHE